MLDDPQNYTVLNALIPSLADLFHDKAEKVRLAFVKLLIKMKHIRAFKVSLSNSFYIYIMYTFFNTMITSSVGYD